MAHQYEVWKVARTVNDGWLQENILNKAARDGLELVQILDPGHESSNLLAIFRRSFA